MFIALSFFLAIAAFLVWATAGKSFSLTGMLQATVVRAVPIALAAMAGILCERVAVINIGIEGMLLAGAFAGALFGSIFGNFFGLILAVLVGGFFGFILAALVVTFRVDQIIAGVAINIFVLGITSPVGALFAALIFGFADSLQQKLAILRTPIPSEFLAMAPYLVTIIVVAGIVGNAKPPQAIGQAYVKEN